ncbi:MAG: MOSC N-terminal beta barrel domain-containing protein [Angustibacter sp.]
MSHADLGVPAVLTGRVGHVVQARTFPVKSMDAIDVPHVRILSDGVEHDRGWAVVGEAGAVVTARQAPRLREVRVAELSPDGPHLWLPDAELAVRAASADAALSALVGQAVRLEKMERQSLPESAPVHLVSRQAVEAATAPGEDSLRACDVEDPRANLTVDLDDVSWLETTWVGRQVAIGEVVLQVAREPRHCLGVYADVVRPGTVNVEDVVELV